MHLLQAVVLQLCFTGLDAANILFLYFPTFSHTRGPLNVARELASRGHVVWSALNTRLANDKRLQIPGVNILQYQSIDDYDIDAFITDKSVEEYFKSGRGPGRGIKLSYLWKRISSLIVQDEDLLESIQRLKFDLIVYDSWPMIKMLTIIAYKLDIPFMYLGTAWSPHDSRTPYVFATMPSPWLPWTPEMNFGTRLVNSLIFSSYYLYDPLSYYRAVALYAPEKPYVTMESLTKKALLWLIELEPLLHYPQATLPNVKFVGSLSASESKPLPDIYKKFMDEAKDGAVIVSFGSHIKKVPETRYEKLIHAFSRTKYRFIFRIDKKISGKPNIMLTEWMPQADLLAHPNTKLFITHCGASGQNEAFLNGVPMIAFPVFGDQPYNAEMLVYKGFGLRMDFNTFSINELVDNINDVIQNSSYSKKIRKAAENTKLRDKTPKDETVYWIEHVLQYGGDHLRSYCQDMPLYQYLNLDVIGFLMFPPLLTIFLMWKCTCMSIRKNCRCSFKLVQKSKTKKV